ncbi:iron-containing alcohol dehydrogenase family protein [Altericista sp. CCNU0014]|uniref:iron-containing alcohol dehydrogenase family protein n=1 Tax=Altericista sp. CCNU0014 TaxID=3082949 RepID=UPI0038503C11
MSYITSTDSVASPAVLAIAPARVFRGAQLLQQAGPIVARLGTRPLIVGGERSLEAVRPALLAALEQQSLVSSEVACKNACTEKSLKRLKQAAIAHQADVVVGVGGGKVLDAAKLLAHQCGLPIVTVPTSAATCAAWTALSNVYTEAGAFQYDVGLPQCPNVLLLDYDIIATAPVRTLIAGIGDALAKWYEASVSSGHSQQTMIIAAVQQARVLRDILLQKSVEAIAQPGSAAWQEAIDATVLMAGVIGGIGGAQCRTVAAHAVHNGLTHVDENHTSLHGEKVAYGILVQLRLEEMLQGSQLAVAARQQLTKFYQEIGLPLTLADLGLGGVSLAALERAAQVACAPGSDLHHLPFAVSPAELLAAMVSTTAPTHLGSPLEQMVALPSPCRQRELEE